LGLDATTNVGKIAARQTRAKALEWSAELRFGVQQRENIEHPTSNAQHPMNGSKAIIGSSMLNVECWMFIGNTPGRTSLRSEASAFALLRRDESARQGSALLCFRVFCVFRGSKPLSFPLCVPGGLAV
jgi:hypothetical protein